MNRACSPGSRRLAAVRDDQRVGPQKSTVRTLGTALVRDDPPALPDAPLVAGMRGGRRARGRRVGVIDALALRISPIPLWCLP